ncbi:uncharacterized protein [Amphiura filiformis]|uniref:uncharacterized protein n=1 Tax=Amphiura filiformis TaxID=82378 RepID=UPI003B219251
MYNMAAAPAEQGQWKLTNEFPTTNLQLPLGIALNHDADIAITSCVRGAKVFSPDGQLKYSFMNDSTIVTDVAVTHDNRYVVVAGYRSKGLEFFNDKGENLSCIPVTDMDEQQSNINSIAVDANGQIIAALVNTTISIHSPNGSLINKFALQTRPLRLTVTPSGNIACSYRETSAVELMDYMGTNVRVVQPPPEVKKWDPGYMCCRDEEMFIVNEVIGDPAGIYRYTDQGQYMGCVTKEVNDPAGIAVSKDGMELFVLERNDCKVKIFQRK